ncbi:DUF2834 domain-containing protein [Roseateles sp.]|uniref:DUF2834 domain-containing protein n=1 Tax=Roseateles sp. TaxID=1971397 RepID=UPI003266EBEE
MRTALILITAAFGAFSLYAMWQVGFIGLWQGGLANIGAQQITLDLIVSSLLLIGFVARDCRAQGRPWWPWALLTLAAGSFGTLAYLLLAAPRQHRARMPASASASA